MESTFLAGAGGLRLAADRWPNPDGAAVVLLHGGGQTRHAWGETAAALAARGFEVISVDLRGHGDSAWSASLDYGLEWFCGDVLAVLAHLGRPAVLVGASLGGIAALLAVAKAAPEQIAGLVLVDITHRPSSDGAQRIQGFMTANPEGFANLDEAADAVAAYLPHRPRPTDPSGLMKNLRQRGGRLHWHWDPAFLAVTADDRFQDDGRLDQAARAVRAPCLLVRGDRSEIVSPEDAEALLALIPHARMIEVKGAAHMVAGDQNTAFGEAMLAFLTGDEGVSPRQ
jgi:pimeloyl-ACP methyl ester carboxylesterase